MFDIMLHQHSEIWLKDLQLLSHLLNQVYWDILLALALIRLPGFTFYVGKIKYSNWNTRIGGTTCYIQLQLTFLLDFTTYSANLNLKGLS